MANTLIEKVAETIQRYSMLTQTARVGVAVSGGADSVVLFKILHELAPTYLVQLVVLHMNHHLRASESDADERFVRDLADSIAVPFVGADSFPAQAGVNLEAAARHERQKFFAACRRVHRLDRIALGHSQSDQAETVLHHFVRGSGLRGVAGMRPVRADNGTIRPLLAVSRNEIRQWAIARGIAWREDSSNGDLAFTRNRLRLKTVPQLSEDYNPNLDAALAHFATLAQTEEDFWDDLVKRTASAFVEQTRLGPVLQVGQLTTLHLALQRRIIRHVLAGLRENRLEGVDFAHIDRILALCGSTVGHDRVLIPGADALRSFDRLLLCESGRLSDEPRGYQLDLRLGESHDLPYGLGTIHFERVNPRDPFYVSFKKDQGLAVERAALGKAIVERQSVLIRNWEPGDVLHRPGREAPVKIKSLFQEHKVVLWERRHWPVLVADGEIAWARQFGVSQKFQVTPENS